MEEGPQTDAPAPEAPTEAPTPMEVETEGAVAEDEVQNPPNQEGQEVRNSVKPLGYFFSKSVALSFYFCQKIIEQKQNNALI